MNQFTDEEALSLARDMVKTNGIKALVDAVWYHDEHLSQGDIERTEFWKKVILLICERLKQFLDDPPTKSGVN